MTKPLEPGRYRFEIVRYTLKPTKVTLCHSPLTERRSAYVLRTFRQNSAALREYTQVLLGSPRAKLTEEDCESLIGRTLVGQVEPSNRPDYVNLVTVFPDDGSILQDSNPANCQETGGAKGQDAG